MKEIDQKIIEKIKKLKPKTQINPAFTSDLRKELLQKQKPSTNSKPLANLFNLFAMKKIIYSFGAILIILTAGLIIFPQIFTAQSPALIASNIEITPVKENAFGSLVNPELNFNSTGLGGGTSEAAPNQNSEEQARDMTVTTTVESAEAIPSVDSPTSANLDTATSSVIPDEKMIAPAPGYYNTYNYNFEYVGDPITLDQNEVKVLKRIKNRGSTSNIFNWLEKIDLGILDLDNFKNTYAQSLSIFEDRSYGYSIYIDFIEESVAINQNWQKWPQCDNQACWEELNRFNRNPENLPSNQKIIDIANAFLDQYDLDISIYDKPQIDNYWWNRELKTASSSGLQIYLPTSFTVRYPLLIDNQKVYFDNGGEYGLDVSVDIKELRVNNVWNLTTQNYQSSDYPAETDSDKIIETVEKGGWQNYDYRDPNGIWITLQIGTPEQAYVKIWKYENNTNTELLVPALVFPINNNENLTQPYYRQKIIVPLAKDILDNWTQPPVHILEMDEAVR